MQIVTQEWKDNQKKTIVPESYLQIYYELSDVEALQDASTSDNGHEFYSDTAQIVSEVVTTIMPYGTLEHNLWKLDGSIEPIPSNPPYQNSGYVGNKISGDDCLFPTGSIPIITISFTKVHTYRIPGIFITFSENFNEWSPHFKMIVYNGTSIVTQQEITGNTDNAVLILEDIYDYDRITIEFYEWSLPNRRPRIESIIMGIREEFTKNDIIDFSQTMEVDPIGASLPNSSIQFSLNNLNGDFDLQNPQGLAKFLIERQAIKVSYGFKRSNGQFEIINAGIYYMSEWDAPQKGLKATFKAKDLLEFMDKTYVKGLYRPSGITYYDLANEVLTDLDILMNEDGTVKWILDDVLKNYTTKAPLPITTVAQCLQYIAQAACCVMYCDRNGQFHIEPINETETDYEIDYFNSYGYPKYTLQKPLKDVSVKIYNYTPKSETTELFNGTLNIQGTKTVTLNYSGIASNATAQVSGGTLNSSTYWSNACELNITGTGNVTITVSGNSIEKSSTEWTIINETEERGETQPVDNPLITSREQADTVGEWVKEWLQKRTQYEVSFRIDPRLDAMDIISLEDAYGENQARTTYQKLSYSGGQFKGDSKGKVI